MTFDKLKSQIEMAESCPDLLYPIAEAYYRV